MTGHGICKYADGAVYEGDWVDNKMHGIGKYTYANGTVDHDGEWRMVNLIIMNEVNHLIIFYLFST